MKKIGIYLVFMALISSCSESYKKYKQGVWHAEISVQNKAIPFQMEIKNQNGKMSWVIINADERITLDTFLINGDSIEVPMHIFDATLKAVNYGDSIKGFFVKNYADDYVLPFSAKFGDSKRFHVSNPPIVNITGKYGVIFMKNDKTTVPAIGIFNQNEEKVTATFLTKTGDYRFLEGVLDGNVLRLSGFDGEHVYLFEAKVDSLGDLQGEFWSGKSGYRTWIGVKNEKAKLPNPNSLTYLKKGYDKIEFSFPNMNQKMVSLNDEKYKGKAVIVQILGSWCPNCMDETAFLSDWYRNNKDKNVEIIGLAYELKPDFNYAKSRVEIMKKRYNIDYEILIAGEGNTKSASASLPMLNEVISFPTTIFIAKTGEIVKIHTGFSGPSTGDYYDEFISDFNATILKMTTENETDN